MGIVIGLRVYILAKSNESPLGTNVFYSRRDSGPIYRWRYEVGHWQVTRISSFDFPPWDLFPTTWKSVPQDLKTQLGQHYME